MTLERVAILAPPGVAPFEFGIGWEAFGVDRSDDGVPRQDTRVVAATPEVQTAAGFTIHVPHGLDAAADADLVVVPAFAGDSAGAGEGIECAELRQLVRHTVERGARVMSFCSGAFLLGAAGVLDGRTCTTHWRHADELARRYTRARVDRDVLFVCDGPLLTSAGTAAGLDLCLHLIRLEHGSETALRVARRMVMPPHRDGGQAQYVEAPIRTRPAETLAPLLGELLEELADEHTIDSLARRCAMSPRTFARRFRDETGTTPHLWLTHQRVLLARRLLENGDDPVDTVAARSGFQTAAMLRHHFTRIVGTSPSGYRRTFNPAARVAATLGD